MRRGIAITGFGRFSVSADGEDRTAAFSPRVRRCLAHLALHAEPIDRGLLAAHLWPEASEASALGSLRRRLHELESALESIGLKRAVERTRNRVSLVPAAQWSIDVARYVILARDPAKADRAAGLYAEPIFPGLHDDVLERERRRLRAVQVELLTDMLTAAIRGGDAAAITTRANDVLRLDPLSEQSAARAIAALRVLGEEDRARRLFDRFNVERNDELENERSSFDLNDVVAQNADLTVLQRLVERADALRGATAGRHFDAIERQMPEIRAALDAAIVRANDVETGARALAALSRFFFDRGHAVEAAGWYDSVILRLPESSPLRAEAMYLRAMVGRNLGNAEHNLPAFEEAIAALRKTGDRTTLAKAMLYGSNAARMTGRVQFAQQLANEALEILAASHDAYLVAFARSALGAAAYANRSVDAARREFEAARAGFAALEARDDEALMTVNVGRCAFAQRELDVAAALLTRARERARGSGNSYIEGHADVGLTLIALDRGDIREARARAARAARISLDGSDMELSVIALEACGELFLALGELTRTRDALAAADGVRSEYLIARAPSEHARAERVRAELAARSMLSANPVAAPEIMMCSLLESVARSYHSL